MLIIPVFSLNLGEPQATATAVTAPVSARAGLDALVSSGIGPGVLRPAEILLPAGAAAPAPGHRITVVSPAAWTRDSRHIADAWSPADPSTAGGKATLAAIRAAAAAVPGARTGGSPAKPEQVPGVRDAVVRGIGHTGRLVTSGALILCLAFIALGGVPVTDVKIFSTGLAAGIIIDATIIRGVLAPALVTLFGRVNWWLPGPAARLLRAAPLASGTAHGPPHGGQRPAGDASPWWAKRDQHTNPKLNKSGLTGSRP